MGAAGPGPGGKEDGMNALELAIRRKENAIVHYKKAMENCGHPSGAKMFRVVLDEEERHLDALKKMGLDLEADLKRLGDVENLATIMDRMSTHEGPDAAVCSLDEMDAFKVAMDMEKDDYAFYKELAAMTLDKKEKALFEKLAQEEEQHYEVLVETHSFLTDTGNWFMWEDHSIAEG